MAWILATNLGGGLCVCILWFWIIFCTCDGYSFKGNIDVGHVMNITLISPRRNRNICKQLFFVLFYLVKDEDVEKVQGKVERRERVQGRRERERERVGERVKQPERGRVREGRKIRGNTRSAEIENYREK